MKQKKLDQLKSTINFGPEEEDLPITDWISISKKVSEGAKLVVIDGIVHDVASFIKEHPGGQNILLSRIGKDATIAFNGGVYRHSKAARNIAALLRVARLAPDQLLLRTQADNFVKEGE